MRKLDAVAYVQNKQYTVILDTHRNIIMHISVISSVEA